MQKSSLFGREGMERVVLLVARFRRRGLQQGIDRAEAGGKPSRLGLSIAVIALPYG